MKKYFLIFIVVIITLIGSCSNNSDNKNHDTTQTPEENINGSRLVYSDGKVFELTSESRFFASNLDLSEFLDYKEDWISYIEKTYEVEIQYKSIYQLKQDELIFNPNYTAAELEYIISAIDKGEIIGLFKLRHPQLVIQLMDRGYILPFNEQLNNNNNWNNLPDEYKNAFSINDQTWALPTRMTEDVSFRLIREDWLDNLGLPLPNTINEFHEALKKMTYSDPDGDSIDNTCGMVFKGISGAEDIFSSFDARLSLMGTAGPVWNPNTDIWEDSMLKPEFIECVNFIRNCTEESIMINSYDGNEFVKGVAGSHFSLWENTYTEENIMENKPELQNIKIYQIPGLSHNIDKNITAINRQYSYPVVLAKNSKHPVSTVNIFIDYFISDIDGYLAARIGIPEVSFTYMGNTVDYQIKDDAGLWFSYPGITHYSPSFDMEFIAEETHPQYLKNTRDRTARLKRAYDSDLCFIMPWDKVFTGLSIEAEGKIQGICNVSTNIIRSMLTGEVAIEDGLTQYRNKARLLGIQEYLDELNKKIGKTSEQYY